MLLTMEVNKLPNKQEDLHSEGWNASLLAWAAELPGNAFTPAAALFLCAAVRRCWPSRVLPPLPLPNGADAPWCRECVV